MMARRSKGVLHRLWCAWRAEAKAAFAALTGRDRVLEVTAGAQTLDFALCRGAARRTLGDIPLDRAAPVAAAPAIRALLAASPGRFDRLDLRAGDGRGLSRRLALPLAARASLREAVRYDLDRQTPFSEDMIHFGTMETGIDRAAGKVFARLDVIPRAELDPALAALAAAGLRPDGVRLGSGDGPDLAPPEARHRAPGWLGAALGLGFAATAVLGLGLLVVPLHRAETGLAEAEAAAHSARQAAARAEALSRRIEVLAARETALADRRRTEPRALDRLAEVTRLLPDDSYLIQMTLAGGRLAMTGYAARATPLLGIIERSDQFAAARFTEPVLPDARMGAERFAIAADLAGASPDAAARP